MFLSKCSVCCVSIDWKNAGLSLYIGNQSGGKYNTGIHTGKAHRYTVVIQVDRRHTGIQDHTILIAPCVGASIQFI